MRIKEEKEALEHFASVFTMMSASTFREIFSATINYVVERIYNNYTLQVQILCIFFTVLTIAPHLSLSGAPYLALLPFFSQFKTKWSKVRVSYPFSTWYSKLCCFSIQHKKWTSSFRFVWLLKQ